MAKKRRLPAALLDPPSAEPAPLDRAARLIASQVLSRLRDRGHAPAAIAALPVTALGEHIASCRVGADGADAHAMRTVDTEQVQRALWGALAYHAHHPGPGMPEDVVLFLPERALDRYTPGWAVYLAPDSPLPNALVLARASAERRGAAYQMLLTRWSGAETR